MRPAVVAAALALAACSAPGQGPTSADLRALAIQQIDVWNASGVDPLRADDSTLLRIAAACNTATAVLTVWRADVRATPQEVTDYCAVALKALGPSAVPAAVEIDDAA